MPKRALRKFLPTPTRLRRVKGLGAFKDIFDRQELWHISRSSIARATGIGLFCAMVPLPGQMLVAVFVAICAFGVLTHLRHEPSHHARGLSGCLPTG